MITWRGSTPNQHPKKTQWFLKWKKLVSLSWWFGFVFFEDPALLKNHNFLQWKSNIKCQLTEKPTNPGNFSFSELFHQSNPVNTTTGWSGASLLDPVLLQWPGIAASAENLQKMGISTVTWKMSTFPKSFYFISAEGKIVKNFLGNIYETSWYAKKTITKILVFEISHHIIHHLSKSTTQPKFSSYLHLSPQWCRTSILTPHRHKLLQRFWVWRSLIWLVILPVISFSWCYFLLDGSWED